MKNRTKNSFTLKDFTVKSLKGFTLVEMLLVMIILSVFSVYFVMNYSKKIKNQLVDYAFAMTVDIKRASLRYFVDHNGVWPGQANNCEFEFVQEALRPYIGDLNENPWGSELSFTCNALLIDSSSASASTEAAEPQVFYPSFIIRQLVPNESVGYSLLRRLPGSDIENLTEGFFWNAYVSMAILPQAVSYISEVVESNGNYSFIARNCPNGLTPQAMIIPQNLCAASNSRALLGYRIQTTFNIGYTSEGSSQNIHIETLGSDGRWTSNFENCVQNISPQIFQYCS